MKTIHLFLLKKTFKSPAGQNQGMTFLEVLLVLVVIGVLAAMVAPMWRENSLRAGANQTGSIFRQVRMRAMANTTAYRLRPDPTAIVPGSNPPLASRFFVQAASGRSCGARTNIVNPPTVASSGNSSLPVNDTDGFATGAEITVGESLERYTVVSVDDENAILFVGGESLGQLGNSLTGAEVELANVWNSQPAVTGILPEDLALPTNENAGEAVAFNSTIGATTWNLCFDAEGTANLYNAFTGQPINAELQLSVTRCMHGSNCIGANQIGNPVNITVTRGGAITVPKYIP